MLKEVLKNSFKTIDLVVHIIRAFPLRVVHMAMNNKVNILSLYPFFGNVDKYRFS